MNALLSVSTGKLEVLIKMPENRPLFLQFLSSSVIGMIGSLLSVFGLALSIFFYVGSDKPETVRQGAARAVEGKLEELARVRTALVEVDHFVAEQQNSLRILDSSLRDLQHERASLEKIVTLDHEKVQALLEYQASLQEKGQWKSQILVFLMGVFSSLTATGLIAFVKRRRLAARLRTT